MDFLPLRRFVPPPTGGASLLKGVACPLPIRISKQGKILAPPAGEASLLKERACPPP